MTAKFNGKTPQAPKRQAPPPTGKPAKLPEKKIETPASVAKARGGSANLGGGIGNTT